MAKSDAVCPRRDLLDECWVCFECITGELPGVYVVEFAEGRPSPIRLLDGMRQWNLCKRCYEEFRSEGVEMEVQPSYNQHYRQRTSSYPWEESPGTKKPDPTGMPRHDELMRHLVL